MGKGERADSGRGRSVCSDVLAECSCYWFYPKVLVSILSLVLFLVLQAHLLVLYGVGVDGTVAIMARLPLQQNTCLVLFNGNRQSRGFRYTWGE